MERESSPHISKKGLPHTQQGFQVSPSAPAPTFQPGPFTLPRSRRKLYVILAGISLVIIGVATAVIVGMWRGDISFHNFYARRARDVPQASSTEMQLVERFMSLKNAGDPAADELLAPLPAVPVEPISPDEADRFKVNDFLHRNIRIQSVRVISPNRFLLATEGNCSGPLLSVRGTKGVDRIQRILFNPDLLVEVRDGLIYGIR